ncbi:MAG: hypothetical protein K2J46_02475, partial [Muribaculaceae bacterium]|nr:hypothetical protein [Muribaculaceae bacterium]
MKRILSTIFSSGLCMFAMAIPAKPGFVAYTQPDGSVINVKIVGDEHGHMIYSAEGNLLIESDGRLEYARFDAKGFPTASGIVATKENDSKIASMQIQPRENVDKWASMMTANRDARLEKLYSKSVIKKASTRAEESENRLVPYNFGRCDVTYPVLGEQKGLVILVSYQDLDFKYGDYDYFNRMLNEEGFSDYGSLGSARDWFVYNSNGQFLPDFDVYGPVVLPNDREYYGGNDAYGNDKRPEEMAIDACRLLDDEIDFTKYDRDGDGVVDNVFIFYAGKGEHDSGIKNTVWPHSWDL